MNLAELRGRIESKQARLAVIGLGYVGLPVAASLAEAGYDVLGLDIDEARLATIQRGENPIEGDEPGLADLLARVAESGRLQISSDYADLADRDVVLIAVETPVDAEHKPSYEALFSALRSAAARLKDGALLIIESTIAPGTMRDVVQATLEAEGRKVNDDVYLGNCPERVMPGKLLHNLWELDRVVGGMTPETAETMAVLYRQIVKGDLDTTDCLTAELVKTAENAYRDVQIAFANEVALISEAVGGDVWKVRELVNKSPGRHMLLPGAGVGGHCIPKDPWLLAHAAEGSQLPLRLIPAAREVNDGMPRHMLALLQQALSERSIELDGARVLVLGYAYLENSDDTRNSPSAALVEAMESAGAEARIHDPFVDAYQGDLLALAEGCQAAVLMVKHEAYLELDLTALASALAEGILVDGRKAFVAAQAEAAGLAFYSLGQGPREVVIKEDL